jgi:predicted phosphoribosyltransferase
VLRRGNPLPGLKGKTVILADDGVAVGSTMHAAIKLCENQGAGRIVVAVPVTGESYKLYVQVAYLFGMGLDELLARGNAGAHEHIEGAIGHRCIFDGHLQECTLLRVHRRFP